MTNTQPAPPGLRVDSFDAPDHSTLLGHDFALLEPAHVEPAARADLGGWPIMPKGHESAETRLLLIELRILSDGERIKLLDRIRTWQASRGVPYFSTLIDCPDDVEVLQRHLANRAVATSPDGGSAWLRFHDPRVFRQLVWILRPDQMGTLLANIRRWTWPGVDGQWHSLVQEEPHPGKRLGPLRLDADQWATIQRIADINAVLASLAREAPELQQDAALAQTVNARLADAARALPRATDDARCLYAEHSVRFGVHLYRHPDMQHRMTPVYAGQQDYLSACADLDDETLRAWATIYELAKDRP